MFVIVSRGFGSYRLDARALSLLPSELLSQLGLSLVIAPGWDGAHSTEIGSTPDRPG